MTYSISDVKKAAMFKMCEHKNYNEVGVEFELDRVYKKADSMKSCVYRVFNSVKNNPGKYGVSEEEAHRVAQIVEARQREHLGVTQFRSSNPNVKDDPTHEMTLRERKQFIASDDIKGLVLGGRNKAAKLINEKLDRISRSKKLLDDISLGELAKVVGIMVDKAQIIQGQSTENIAILSKNIDANLSPEESLDMVLKMREVTQSEKQK